MATVTELVAVATRWPDASFKATETAGLSAAPGNGWVTLCACYGTGRLLLELQGGGDRHGSDRQREVLRGIGGDAVAGGERQTVAPASSRHRCAAEGAGAIAVVHKGHAGRQGPR